MSDTESESQVMKSARICPARAEVKSACKYCGVHTQRWVCSKCPALRYSSTSSVNSHLHSHGHRMVLISISPEPLVGGAALLSDSAEEITPCVVPLRRLVMGVPATTQTEVCTAVVGGELRGLQ